VSFGTAFFLNSVTPVIVMDMHITHNGDATVCDEIYLKSNKILVMKLKEIKMFKRLFRAMVLARQTSAAMQALQYMSDRQLEDIGFTRETFVEQIKANVLDELDAADAEKSQSAPVNPNLIGAV
jgi:uncharacterized protein YjiS (DUF1127 family)